MKRNTLILIIYAMMFSSCAITNKYPDKEYMILKTGFMEGRATLEQATEFRDRLARLYYDNQDEVSRVFKEQYRLALIDYKDAKETLGSDYHRQANHYNQFTWAYVVACLNTYNIMDYNVNDKGCDKPIFDIEGKM